MIKQIQLTNFTHFDLLTIDIKEKHVTLSGTNGVGKSSVLESIALCYYGLDLTGSREIARFIKKGCDSATVCLSLENGTVLLRTIKRNGSSISVNGKEMSQTQFERIHQSVPYDFFLPAINPWQWFSMDYKARRSVLFQLLPDLDTRGLFIENYREDLVDRFMNTTYTEANRMVKETELSIESLKGRLIQIEQQLLTTIDPLEFDEARYEELSKVLDTYRNSDSTLKHEEALFKLYNKQFVENQGKIGTLKALDREFEEGVEKIQFQLKYRTNNIEELEGILAKKPQIERVMNMLDLEVEELEKELEEMSRILSTNVCPICGNNLHSRNVYSDRMQEVDSLWNEKKQKLMRYKTSFATLQKLDIDMNGYIALKNETEAKKNAIQETVDMSMTSDTLNERRKKYQEIHDKVKSIVWTPKLAEELQALHDKKAELKALKRITTEAKESVQEQQNKLKLQLGKLTSELKDLQILQDALSPKGIESIKAAKHAKTIKTYIQRYDRSIDIQTTEILKTDETRFKEVLNIRWRGMKEDQLSTGQKIKLAIIFCLVLQDLIYNAMDKRVDLLLLDNASLVADLDALRTVILPDTMQTFMCLNNDENKLTITQS